MAEAVGGRWVRDDVVTRAQAGDEASIALLASNAFPHVRRFAFSLCANDQDAEEATQEAMIVLFRRIGTLRATAALSSWMFRVVRNECLRRVRTLVSSTAPVGAVGLSAEDATLDRLTVQELVQAIAALPDDQRRVLVLRDVQGLPGRTVARQLGLSVPAMKSRLQRARAAIREDIGSVRRTDPRAVVGPAGEVIG